MGTVLFSQFSKVRAVFFDAGGTLFCPTPSVGEIYSQVASRHGLHAQPARLENAFHTLWQRRDGLASLAGHSGEKEEKAWWRSLVLEVFSRFGRIRDFEAFFEELYERFASPEVWRLFPDALPTLRQLKEKGKILGIVSNWDSRLFGICKGLGLERCLDFILASAVFGAAKPSPRIFEEALKKAGVLAEEALHIGDSLEDDVLGATRAGIHAVFLDRQGNRASQAATAFDAPALAGVANAVPASGSIPQAGGGEAKLSRPLTISRLQFLCRMFEN